MAKPKTALEKIAAIAKKIQKLQGEITKIQDGCRHSDIKVVVGHNGYGTDYSTYCVCQLCKKSWFHDGYCVGDHARC